MRPILVAMSAPKGPENKDAEELAERFLALWSEYLTALLADPKLAEPARQWFDLAMGAVHKAGQNAAQHEPGAASPASARSAASRPAADAAAAAGAPGERDAALGELTRRLDELNERVAALEARRAKPARPRARRPSVRR
jgi:hypothetical protein